MTGLLVIGLYAVIQKLARSDLSNRMRELKSPQEAVTSSIPERSGRRIVSMDERQRMRNSY